MTSVSGNHGKSDGALGTTWGGGKSTGKPIAWLVTGTKTGSGTGTPHSGSSNNDDSRTGSPPHHGVGRGVP